MRRAGAIGCALIAVFCYTSLAQPDEQEGEETVHLIPVRIGDKWNYVNRSGRAIFPLKFRHAQEFSDGLARIASPGGGVDGPFGFIDPTGEVVIQPRFEAATAFSEGFARVRDKGARNYHFIDKTGKPLTDARFWWGGPSLGHLGSFSEGLAMVTMEVFDGVKWGYIDRTGQVVIPARYDGARCFSEGLAWVNVGMRRQGGLLLAGKWSLIDKTGRVVVEFGLLVQDPAPFSEGLARVCCPWWGFVDKAGKVVIGGEGKFADAGDFSERLARVKVEDERRGTELWGYIEKNGRMAIKPQFTEASDFAEGLAAAGVGNPMSDAGVRHGYIDRTGKFVIRPQFALAGAFRDGLA